MKATGSHRPLIPAQGILTFTALSQVVLYLWASGAITGALAASALAGAFLFGLLARAVRDVMAEYGSDS